MSPFSDNGNTFLGDGFGHNSDYLGEICFNTSITGYQEILTDPSYFKQIISDNCKGHTFVQNKVQICMTEN